MKYFKVVNISDLSYTDNQNGAWQTYLAQVDRVALYLDQTLYLA